MSEHATYPITLPALAVRQPLGEFFATRIPARVLSQVSFSERAYVSSHDTNMVSYNVRGSQRIESQERLKEIARYIDTAEAAFPNAIILAANYTPSGRGEAIESNDRWHVQRASDDCLTLVIPTSKPLAALIDGQHRLHAFDLAMDERCDMELLCSVYIDLPNPYQAYLFATINFNQRPVDRSLAYELFGATLDDEPPDQWSPEKLAVFLTRRLNTESGSPLRGHIIVAPQNDDLLELTKKATWCVSTATIVDGILALISKNAKRDRDQILRERAGPRRSRTLIENDGSPLRTLYIEGNDLAIYTAVKNFFVAVEAVLWKHASENSYIRKTVGLLALFGVLKRLLERFEQEKKVSVSFFEELLRPAGGIDFSNAFFQASGTGRGRILKTIEFGIYGMDGIVGPRTNEGELTTIRELYGK